MRRPSKVKEERSSEESKENQAPNNDEEGAVGGAPAPIPKRKTDEDKTIDSISSDMSKKVKVHLFKPPKNGEYNFLFQLSVEVIPVEPVKIEILSDDEKMPPPMAPPKKAGRPKKAAKEAERTTRSKLKEELPTEQNTTRTTRTKSRKKAEQTTNESSTTMRSEQSTNESSAAIRAVVKLEKLSLEDVIAATTTPPSGTRPPSGTSEASVYEDAVVSQKTSDATFLKPPGNLSKQNTPNATFAVPGNATFQVESPNEMNGTYTLPQQGKTPSGHDSIMTEDRSDEEPEPPAPKTKPAKLKTVMSEPVYKNGKLVTKTQELFNPVLQSPVKSRVQAFEKMTTPSFTSPMIGKLRSKPSNATPHDQRKPSTSKHTTPSYYQQASAVPLLLSKAASTSKLAHVQKHTSTQKANSLSRENSVGRTEDLKKATAEEKKRKRDERQRMAQQQREQMEKEKRSKAAALLKEKEERAKKHKQQMEEQAKMQRLQEQKREEMVRLEQQRRLEQQQLEAMRSKHNDSLQRQALHTQMSKNREATHEFAILETDDSTDDEGKMNRRRPQAPEWSKGKF